MPQLTLNATQEAWDRFLPALENNLKRLEGESDSNLAKRWIAIRARALVKGYEDGLAHNGVVVGEIFT